METRKLLDLVSVGKATYEDFIRLDIHTVEDLVGRDEQQLYDELKEIMKLEYLDMCVLDVFTTAIKQAENPNLPDEQKQWHYWSKVRKGRQVVL